MNLYSKKAKPFQTREASRCSLMRYTFSRLLSVARLFIRSSDDELLELSLSSFCRFTTWTCAGSSSGGVLLIAWCDSTVLDVERCSVFCIVVYNPSLSFFFLPSHIQHPYTHIANVMSNNIVTRLGAIVTTKINREWHEGK